MVQEEVEAEKPDSSKIVSSVYRCVDMEHSELYRDSTRGVLILIVHFDGVRLQVGY